MKVTICDKLAIAGHEILHSFHLGLYLITYLFKHTENEA